MIIAYIFKKTVVLAYINIAIFIIQEKSAYLLTYAFLLTFIHIQFLFMNQK